MKRLSLLAAVLLLIALSGSVYAAATLNVSDGFASSGPISSASGLVSYSNPSFDNGAWSITILSAQTKPAVGSSSSPFMDILIQAQSFSLASPPRNLTITFSDNNFGPTSGTIQAPLSGHSVSGNGQALTYNTYLDSGNVVGAQTILLTSSGALSDPYTSLKTAPISQSLYALTQVVTIAGTPTGGAGSIYSVEASFSLVPEPTALALVALGAALLSFRRNRA